MEKVLDQIKMITGLYSYIGNPCITDPCLPGMVYAVLANERYYYLTVNGSFFSNNRSWNVYTPVPNDMVSVTGYVSEKKDIFGKPFLTIEIISLQRVK